MNYYRKDVLLNLFCSLKKCVKIFYENVEKPSLEVSTFYLQDERSHHSSNTMN